ncbi:MAG: DUF397 domain-containing protein [Streptosporangiaceae bacterium]
MPVRHPDLSDAVWRKSVRSTGDGQNCVEVAANLPSIVAVRDSKNRQGPALILTHTQWRALLEVARSNGFRPTA